jgi:hypothetical protein
VVVVVVVIVVVVVVRVVVVVVVVVVAVVVVVVVVVAVVVVVVVIVVVEVEVEVEVVVVVVVVVVVKMAPTFQKSRIHLTIPGTTRVSGSKIHKPYVWHAAYIVYSEPESSRFFRNVGEFIPKYTESHSCRERELSDKRIMIVQHEHSIAVLHLHNSEVNRAASDAWLKTLTNYR